MTRENAYKLLNLPSTCEDEDEIKKAFKKLAMKYHPDKEGGSKESFQKIHEAKEVLLNKNTVNVNGRSYSQEQYEQAMREYVKRAHEEMKHYEEKMQANWRLTKVKMIIFGLYFVKVLLFMIFGWGKGFTWTLLSLGIFFYLIHKAPQILSIYDWLVKRFKKK